MSAPPVHSVNENVDLFSGNLQLSHTDAFFPGNGGLDLKLVRNYNSAIWGRRDIIPPVLVAQQDQSSLGLGWSMHMGIVRNPNGMGSDNVFLAQ